MIPSGRWLGAEAPYDILMTRPAVLLGEVHDRADHHLWQAAVIEALAVRGKVAVGCEMFPAEADLILADWVAGRIGFGDLLRLTDWERVWGFDAGLYRPIFDLCRTKGIALHGLNVERALVRGRKLTGWTALEALGIPPPLPSPPAYRQHLFDLTGGVRPGRAAQDPQDPAFDAFVAAQEVWDRAFACRLARMRGALPIGIIGMGHLMPGGGVGWQGQDLGLGAAAVVLPCDAPLAEGSADFAYLLAG
jgi:uncharacterized iron-regulated protein